jgi:hypothetical protein
MPVRFEDFVEAGELPPVKVSEVRSATNLSSVPSGWRVAFNGRVWSAERGERRLFSSSEQGLLAEISKLKGRKS